MFDSPCITSPSDDLASASSTVIGPPSSRAADHLDAVEYPCCADGTAVLF